jgi:hypothetical protein
MVMTYTDKDLAIAENKTKLEDMVIGKVYEIHLNDCCVVAVTKPSALLELVPVMSDEEGDDSVLFNRYVFDWGIIEYAGNQCYAVEVENE